jgi:hypothetical protein
MVQLSENNVVEVSLALQKTNAQMDNHAGRFFE